MDTINLGGGFPTNFGNHTVPNHPSMPMLSRQHCMCIGDKMPRVIAEPGRALVGNAGIIDEVVLVSQKSVCDTVRWVSGCW